GGGPTPGGRRGPRGHVGAVLGRRHQGPAPGHHPRQPRALTPSPCPPPLLHEGSPVRIAVAGCLPKMTAAFPLQMEENSGNMLHPRAPQRILGPKRTVEYHTQRWVLAGEKNFADFVNKHCDHLVISMTNSVKVNSTMTKRYVNFERMLDMYDVPITIF